MNVWDKLIKSHYLKYNLNAKKLTLPYFIISNPHSITLTNLQFILEDLS